MSLRGLVRAFVAAKTTVVLLCSLAVLLLFNVVLPQESVLGEERFGAMVEESSWARFFLVDLRLGNIPTSPLFLVTLGLFLLNLASVLVSRVGPTWRRIAIRPRSEKGLTAWARLEESISATVPADWKAGRAARTLRGFGYHVNKVGDRTFFAVKHRTAPIGFLLFHVSFFLLFAGGVLIYYTRFVGVAVLSEGQDFTGRYSEILRRAPLGGEPNVRFTVGRVDPRFERGEPVHLSATFRFQQAGSPVEKRSRVNDPARWGATSILVSESGLAPVLWLQDARGFTLDRVVAPVRTRGAEPTDVPLADRRWTARIFPQSADSPFPARSDLAGASVDLQVLAETGPVFSGTLRPGEAADLEDVRLVLEAIRYWVGVRVVSEHGGGLLIAGFVIGVVGLVWRLLLYRREVVVTWSASELRLVGRSEYYSAHFQSELRSICSALARGQGSAEAKGSAAEG